MFSLSCFLRFNIAKYVIVYLRCFTSLCLFFVFSDVTGYVRTQFDRVFEGGKPNCLFFIVCWYSASADSTSTSTFYNFTPVTGIFCPLNIVVDVLTSLILYAVGCGAEFGNSVLYDKRLIVTSVVAMEDRSSSC